MAESAWDVLRSVSPSQVFAPPYPALEKPDPLREQLPKPIWPQFTSDHRGALTAVGVALLTLGITGFVSLGVGAAISGKGLHHVFAIEALCWVLILLGIICLELLWISLANERALNRRLAGCLADGGLLLYESWQTDEKDEKAVDDLSKRVAAWSRRTAVTIYPYSQSKAMHFRNNSGQLVTVAFVGTLGIHGVQLELDTRLARLGEIIDR